VKTFPSKKKTIINDPIYGFISISDELIFRLIEHPYFQRLRRITQLGLTHLVYPGAKHTRFQHAIGAMHLMGQAIEVLRSKGHAITDEEAKAVTIAILLHDIGHGPYSHTLENSIVEGISHEDISAIFMDKLNAEFDGELTLALKVFRDKYKKRFLHQLVSSQLDMDRLDYLRRDSFFTGVSEGVTSTERIIKMLNVVNDELAVDYKGIYSIEKFIIARRLMYWQVYLHKTAVASEYLLLNILKRAKEIAGNDGELFCSPVLKPFLHNHYTKKDFLKDPGLFENFAQLDDYDIMASVKAWANHPDKILSTLSNMLVNRKLYKIEIQNSTFSKEEINKQKTKITRKRKLKGKEAGYFVFTGTLINSAYNPQSDRINILFKDGSVKDVAEAADLLNISMLSKAVKKYFLCYPNGL